jgi:5-(carboxyamino)imidazole ribonucleotide mutase
MPPGMPVATVGVGRGDNAAILAGQMLALADIDIASRISQYRDKRAKQVLIDDAEIRK